MQAITWMLTTAYICTLTDASGCMTIASAVEIRFTSTGDLRNAFERAAADVRACAGIAGDASSGRRLKGWGLRYTSEHPDVEVATLENICRNAAQLAQSGELLPELADIGWLRKGAAAVSGLGKVTLSFLAAAGTKHPAASIVAEVQDKFLWEPFFLEESGGLWRPLRGAHLWRVCKRRRLAGRGAVGWDGRLPVLQP